MSTHDKRKTAPPLCYVILNVFAACANFPRGLFRITDRFSRKERKGRQGSEIEQSKEFLRNHFSILFDLCDLCVLCGKILLLSLGCGSEALGASW